MIEISTPAPAVLTEAPVVAELVRNGFVESVHHASVVVTGPDGSVERAWGDAQSPMFPRSSNKPMQALAMVRHGLDLPDDLGPDQVPRLALRQRVGHDVEVLDRPVEHLDARRRGR